MAATGRPANIEIHQQGEVSGEHQLQRGTRTQFSVTAGDTGTRSPTSATKPVKSVTLKVYTMGEECQEMKFPSGRLTTTQQILDKVLPSLRILEPDKEVFSLWLKSKHLKLQLKPYHLPCKLYRRWKDLLSQYTCATYDEVCKDEPLLCLQRNAFLTLDKEKSLLTSSEVDHSSTINLLYQEAVHNVTKNPYPIDREALHFLAGLQGAVSRAEKKTEPVLQQTNICQFYPSHIYAETRSFGSIFSSKPTAALRHTQEEFSKHMRSEFAACSDALKLKVSYLEKCREHSIYGSVLFRGQIKKAPKAHHKLYYKDRQVYVAINTESVHVLSASSPPEVLLHEPLSNLCWEFQPCTVEGEDFFSSLWLEYETLADDKSRKVFRLLQVFSRQAPMMDAMLCRCVGDLDLTAEGKIPAATSDTLTKLEAQQHKLHCDEYSEDGVCLKLSTDSLSRSKDRKRSQSPGKSLGAITEVPMTEIKPPPVGRTTSI